MKLLLDGRYLHSPNTGLARFVKRTIEVLATAPEVTQVVLLTQGSPEICDSLPGKFQRLESSVKLFTPGEGFYLESVRRKLGNPVFLSPHFIAPIGKSGTTVVTIHDLIPLKIAGYFGPFKTLYYRYLNWVALNRADLILTVSESTYRDCVEIFGVAKSRIRVIGNALDPCFSNYEKDLEGLNSVRRSLNLPINYFLYVGNFKAHKNVEQLLEAFLSLNNVEPAPYLVMVGGNPADLNQHWRKVATEHSKVRLLSGVNDKELAAIYSMARSLVFVSKYEGFGFPLLEAMNFGIPVIIANTSSLPEIGGNAVVKVDPNDTVEIASAMRTLFTNSEIRDRLGGLGRIRAAEFSQAVFHKKLIDSLSSIC